MISPAVELFTIRRLRLADVQTVAEIELRCFPDPWPEFSFIEMLTEGNICWAAHADQTLAGYLLAVPVGRRLHLANIAVDIPFRRQGLGRMMLHRLCRVARRGGFRAIALEVRPSNLPALEFYRSEGFTHAGVKRGYYRGREDALVYRKEL